MEVDVTAPGVAILSTVPTGGCKLCDPTGYKQFSGTSMATPHVTGAAARLISRGFSAAQTWEHLAGTAKDLSYPGSTTSPVGTHRRAERHHASAIVHAHYGYGGPRRVVYLPIDGQHMGGKQFTVALEARDERKPDQIALKSLKCG